MQQHTRVEKGKQLSNKVTLASPNQNLWFILFDRSSGRQSLLIFEPSRNSKDDSETAETPLVNLLFLREKYRRIPYKLWQNVFLTV